MITLEQALEFIKQTVSERDSFRIERDNFRESNNNMRLLVERQDQVISQMREQLGNMRMILDRKCQCNKLIK